MNISFLKSVEKRLKESRIASPAAEAEQLVRHFSGMDRVQYYAGEKVIDFRARRSVEAALKIRLKGKPLSYVLKETEFFGLKFFVSPDALIPRPETEMLVEEALKVIRDIKNPRILDLGTGTGCLAVCLTIHRPDCRMTALDVSTKALKIARKNLNLHRLGKKVTLQESDLFSAFGLKKKNHWDLIITNPPYVPKDDFPYLSREVLCEPRLALDGGPQGFSIIDLILERAPYFLKSYGWLLMEIGGGQARHLAEKISKDKRFRSLRFVRDLNGIDRVLVVQTNG